MMTGEIIVSAAGGLLGVASAVLAFAAEGTKLTPKDIKVSSRGCEYPGSPAFALALCSLALLLMAQLIASCAGGCCGCCRPRAGASKCRRAMGILTSVLSWVAALFAVDFYLQGAVWNAAVVRDPATETECYVLSGGVLAGGAVLSLAAVALGIASYFLLTRAPAVAAAAELGGGYPQGIGMPQWPAQGNGGQAPPQPPPAQGVGEADKPQFAPPGQGHAPVNV